MGNDMCTVITFILLAFINIQLVLYMDFSTFLKNIEEGATAANVVEKMDTVGVKRKLIKRDSRLYDARVPAAESLASEAKGPPMGDRSLHIPLLVKSNEKSDILDARNINGGSTNVEEEVRVKESSPLGTRLTERQGTVNMPRNAALLRRFTAQGPHEESMSTPENTVSAGFVENETKTVNAQALPVKSSIEKIDQMDINGNEGEELIKHRQLVSPYIENMDTGEIQRNDHRNGEKRIQPAKSSMENNGIDKNEGHEDANVQKPTQLAEPTIENTTGTRTKSVNEGNDLKEQDHLIKSTTNDNNKTGTATHQGNIDIYFKKQKLSVKDTVEDTIENNDVNTKAENKATDKKETVLVKTITEQTVTETKRGDEDVNAKKQSILRHTTTESNDNSRNNKGNKDIEMKKQTLLVKDGVETTGTITKQGIQEKGITEQPAVLKTENNGIATKQENLGPEDEEFLIRTTAKANSKNRTNVNADAKSQAHAQTSRSVVDNSSSDVGLGQNKHSTLKEQPQAVTLVNTIGTQNVSPGEVPLVRAVDQPLESKQNVPASEIPLTNRAGDVPLAHAVDQPSAGTQKASASETPLTKTAGDVPLAHAVDQPSAGTQNASASETTSTKTAGDVPLAHAVDQPSTGTQNASASETTLTKTAGDVLLVRAVDQPSTDAQNGSASDTTLTKTAGDVPLAQVAQHTIETASINIRTKDATNVTRATQANETSVENTVKEGIVTNGMKSDESWDRITRMESHGEYGFNATATDSLTLHRTLPDIRPEKCHTIKYDIDRLPTTSIIVPFHNEAWSTLLRTVHSVIDATPDVLLKEVILVDDNSTLDYLATPLADYVATLKKVKLLRLGKRGGLMVARQHGASHASGDVLFFLDSHSEMGSDWLQPLAARIKECRTCVVIPVMDLIKPDDFDFMRAIPDYRGTFDWDMTFRWRKIPLDVLKNRPDELSPIPTPTMVGCAHGIERNYFWELGAYDTTMEIWGSENIEHSFRIWMCGGRLETIPCSRVAHVFKHGGLTYTFKSIKNKPNEIIQKNHIKTVELWLDDHRELFYATQESIQAVNYTHIRRRKELRERLNCKPFQWYLRNIIPDTPIPKKSDLHFGQLIHLNKHDTCLGYDVIPRDGHVISTTACSDQYVAEHAFHFDTSGHFMFYARCFTLTKNETLDLIIECNHAANTWVFEDSMLIHSGTNRCLGLDENDHVAMKPCDKTDTSQKWRFSYKFNWEARRPWEEDTETKHH